MLIMTGSFLFPSLLIVIDIGNVTGDIKIGNIGMLEGNALCIARFKNLPSDQDARF